MEEFYLSLATNNAMEAADRMRVQSRYVNLGENVSSLRIILRRDGFNLFEHGRIWGIMGNMSLVSVQQLPYCKKHTCEMTPYFQVITSLGNNFFPLKHDSLQWLLMQIWWSRNYMTELYNNYCNTDRSDKWMNDRKNSGMKCRHLAELSFGAALSTISTKQYWR